MSSTEVLFAAILKLTDVKQAELARELGVPRSTLASWLAGYAPMPDEAILKTHRLLTSRLARVRDGESTAAVGQPAGVKP